MALSFFQMKKELSKGFQGVIAIGGDDAGQVEQLKAMIRDQVVTGPMGDLNHDRLSAKEKGPHDVLTIAQTLPMMAPQRLIEVSDAEQWGGKDTGTEAKALDDFLEFCKTPPQDAVILLIFNKMDMRRKWLKALGKVVLLGQFKSPKEGDMPEVIFALAEEFELKVQDEAVDALTLSVGADTLMMRRAIEKLHLACESRVVTVADVSIYVASTRIEDAFALGRAVLNGERHPALSSLFRLKENKEVPLRLLGMLAWQLRQVSQARALLDTGCHSGEIGKRLRLFGYRLQPVMRAAQRMPLRHHNRRLTLLAELDQSLKSTRGDPWLHLEKTIMRLCPE